MSSAIRSSPISLRNLLSSRVATAGRASASNRAIGIGENHREVSEQVTSPNPGVIARRSALPGMVVALAAICILFVMSATASAQDEETTTALCANGVAVPDPDSNADLVAECEILLAAMPMLVGEEGGERLNWSADVAIHDWFGVVASSGRVTMLSLPRANLNGTIPPEFGQLTQLTVLDLSHNALTGPIPAELGNLVDLGWLWLWDNELSGEIPPELGNLSSLLRMDIDWNQLTGEIPPELGKLKKLSVLYLGPNELTGEIPEALTQLTQLTLLSLRQNQLSGSIPSGIGELPLLSVLAVSQNSLTGCFPNQLDTDDHYTDQERAGLPFCGEDSVASGGARIDGVAEPGSWVMASRGTIVGADGPPDNDAIDWQWQRCDSQGGDCVELESTQAGYLVTEEDQGSTLRVVATFADADGDGQGPLASAPLYVPMPRNEETTWQPTGTISASELFALEDGLRSILGRQDNQWVRFAQLADDELVPGSLDFRIEIGDSIWLTD